MGGDGGSGGFDVIATGGCGWAASPSAPWIHVTSQTNTAGTASAFYTVDANHDPEDRAGRIDVGTTFYPITQAAAGQPPPPPPACVNGVFPSSATWGGNGGQGTITVSTSGGCTWTASSSAGWVTLAAVTGAGSTLLGYTVAPNASTTARTATLTIGTATFLVTQDVAGTTGGGAGGGDPVPGCTFVASPRYLVFTAEGQTATIHVSAPAGCVAIAAPPVSWLSVTTSQGAGDWSTDVTSGANTGPDPRGTVLYIGNTFIVIDQLGLDGARVQAVSAVPQICVDCDPPLPDPGTPPIPLVSRNCGTSDCDGDGIDDDLEDHLAVRWFPNIHSVSGDCGRILTFNPPSGLAIWQPAIFHTRYMAYGGVIDPNHIAISYEILYTVDCGPPGGTLQHLFAHQGDNEPFVVFLSKAADGSWDTAASFQRISAAAHTGTVFDVQSSSSALNLNGRPDIWVGFMKHGNFAERSQCSPDWLNFCVDPGIVGATYRLFNVGERLAPFIDDLAPVYSGWNGQSVWRCAQFYGAGVITDGLYLAPFRNLPSVPAGVGNWDDGDIVPNLFQFRPRTGCGS